MFAIAAAVWALRTPRAANLRLAPGLVLWQDVIWRADLMSGRSASVAAYLGYGPAHTAYDRRRGNARPLHSSVVWLTP